MMKNSRRLEKSIALAFGLAFACAALADTEAGQVQSLTGTLTAKSADGALRQLVQKGEVAPGDTLYTGRDSYARVHFTDGGEITLRPNTQFLIERYSYAEPQPDKDSAGFSLLKGSLRALSGLISKRGNKDSYEMKTPVATIGIRGTEYGLQVCNNDCDDLKMADGSTPPNGLLSQVGEGQIVERNNGGELLIEMGSFGYVGNANSIPQKIAPSQALKIEVPAHVMQQLERGSPGRERRQCSG
jgi:hypothetical protein